MRRSVRKIAAALAVISAATVLVVAPAQAAGRAGRCAAMETYTVKTFHMTMKARKKVYRVGDVAKLDIKVTRPAHEDPAGGGVPITPPVSEPAAEVPVGVGLQVGDVFLFGFAVTNEKGEATANVKLYPWTRPGIADVAALARKDVVDGGIASCFYVQEVGYTGCPACFKIKN